MRAVLPPPLPVITIRDDADQTLPTVRYHFKGKAPTERDADQ